MSVCKIFPGRTTIIPLSSHSRDRITGILGGCGGRSDAEFQFKVTRYGWGDREGGTVRPLRLV